MLSHWSAAALWGIGREPDVIEISTLFGCFHRPPRIRTHRRYGLRPDDVGEVRSIPVTSVSRTILDLAGQPRWAPAYVERAINEADRLGLLDPDTLRGKLDDYTGEPGVGRLGELLDRETFRLTESELEREFLGLVERAGLPVPETGRRVNGFEVDVFWPDLGLVVETDGLRYHRTPAQQARDRLRDQTHTAAGMTTLRFTHRQVHFEAAKVGAILAKVARRLAADGSE